MVLLSSLGIAGAIGLVAATKLKKAEGTGPNGGNGGNGNGDGTTHVDANGIALPQPLEDQGFHLQVTEETWDYHENFRNDGHRYDFEGFCWPSKAVIGYFFLPSGFTNDEVSAKLNGGPHNDTNPEWADTMDLGITNFTGTKSRLRFEETHGDYSGDISPQSLNIGECRGKWRGYIGLKVNLDMDDDGIFDHFAIIGAVDTGGLDSAENPLNEWEMVYLRIFSPDEADSIHNGLKEYFENYVCTIGQGSESQETIRIDNEPPSGLQWKYVTLKKLEAVRVA